MATIKERLSDTRTVKAPFPASTAIAIGDLLFWNTTAVAKFSAQTDQGTEAANQALAASLFIGVSADQRLSTETSAADRVVVTDGVFDCTCPSTTWEVGDLVGPSEADSGTALENQQVEKVTVATRAIGYCVQRESSATTTVRCRLIGYYTPNVVYRGNLNATLADDTPLILGTGSDANLLWSTGDADNHSLVLGLGDTNQALHITDLAAIATDWNVSADTHPTVYVHSNTTPATDYMTFGAHDGTTGRINIAGGTTISVDIAGTASAHFDADGIGLADDVSVVLGTGSDAELLWSTGDADNHTTVLALGDSNQGLHVTDLGARATDWNIAATTHPNVYIHSNTTPATDYLRLGDHDGTEADIDVVGGTSLALKLAGTEYASLRATGLAVGTYVEAATAGTDQVTIKSTGTAPSGTGANVGHLYADYETDDDELFWLSGTVGTATQLTT